MFPSLVESSIVLSSLLNFISKIIFRKNLSPLLSKKKNPSSSQSNEGVDVPISSVNIDTVRLMVMK